MVSTKTVDRLAMFFDHHSLGPAIVSSGHALPFRAHPLPDGAGPGEPPMARVQAGARLAVGLVTTDPGEPSPRSGEARSQNEATLPAPASPWSPWMPARGTLARLTSEKGPVVVIPVETTRATHRSQGEGVLPTPSLRSAEQQPPGASRALASGAGQPISSQSTGAPLLANAPAEPGTAGEVFTDGTPTDGSNPWIDALVWGGAWADTNGLPSTGGPVTITYALVQGTDPYQVITGPSMTWSEEGLVAVTAALNSWENVANIDFQMTMDASGADVWIWQGTESQADGALGWSEVPAYSAGEPLFTVFNGEDPS